MSGLRLAIQIILVIAAVLLIIVVLLQKSKSSGLGSAYGSDTETFTQRGKAVSREAKLQKITVIIGICMGVLALALLVIPVAA